MRDRVTRAMQVEQNDARLMDAARKVFVRHGYHAASLDQVAAAAGLTKGAVYARFASKADLMLALLDERIRERTEQMQQVVAASGRSSSTVTAALTRQWIAQARADADWQLLVLEFRIHAARDRALNARFREANARLCTAIADAFAPAAGKRASAHDVARIAMALADGITLERAADPDASTALYETAAAALVKGLGG